MITKLEAGSVTARGLGDRTGPLTLIVCFHTIPASTRANAEGTT